MKTLAALTAIGLLLTACGPADAQIAASVEETTTAVALQWTPTPQPTATPEPTPEMTPTPKHKLLLKGLEISRDDFGILKDLTSAPRQVDCDYKFFEPIDDYCYYFPYGASRALLHIELYRFKDAEEAIQNNADAISYFEQRSDTEYPIDADFNVPENTWLFGRKDALLSGFQTGETIALFHFYTSGDDQERETSLLLPMLQAQYSMLMIGGYE